MEQFEYVFASVLGLLMSRWFLIVRKRRRCCNGIAARFFRRFEAPGMKLARFRLKLALSFLVGATLHRIWLAEVKGDTREMNGSPHAQRMPIRSTILALHHRWRLQRKGVASVLMGLLLGGVALSRDAVALGGCEIEMVRAAHRHNEPLQVLYSVGLTETGKRGFMQPYAMNAEGRAVLPTTLSEALRQFAVLRSKGSNLIDIGCMQVNFLYHHKSFSSVADMFQPGRNVDYAARLLKELKGREGSWTMAVARYNAGPNNNPAQRKYVCSVIRSMIGAGMGGWTPGARSLCGG